MRYLLIAAALLAMTGAFAAGSATAVVSLTIDNFCSIAKVADVSISAAGDAGSVSATASFTYTANAACTITPSISGAAPLTWALDSALPVAKPAAVAAPVAFPFTISGITPAVPAGAYAGSVVASIAIP